MKQFKCPLLPYFLFPTQVPQGCWCNLRHWPWMSSSTCLATCYVRISPSRLCSDNCAPNGSGCKFPLYLRCVLSQDRHLPIFPPLASVRTCHPLIPYSPSCNVSCMSLCPGPQCSQGSWPFFFSFPWGPLSGSKSINKCKQVCDVCMHVWGWDIVSKSLQQKHLCPSPCPLKALDSWVLFKHVFPHLLYLCLGYKHELREK